MIVWLQLPDIFAVALLAGGFGSVLRRNRIAGLELWLIAWVAVVCYHIGLMFVALPGGAGILLSIFSMASLLVAAFLFSWATVVHRELWANRLIAAALLGTRLLYIVLVTLSAPGPWLTASAILIGVLPLAGHLYARQSKNGMRLVNCLMQVVVAAGLLAMQYTGHLTRGSAICLILSLAFLMTTLHLMRGERYKLAGGCITLWGLAAWSASLMVRAFLHLNPAAVLAHATLWDLPQYIIASGMTLMLLEQQIQRSDYLALHDELTGLANRRLLKDRLENSLQRASRTNIQVALLVIDLDLFKHINDTYGHPAGDQVLRRVASIFATRLRKADTLARTGGDEFSLLLQEPAELPAACTVARSLLSLIETPFPLNGVQVHVGASIGIAVYPLDGLTADDLIEAADRRMYIAKQSGRNRFAISDEITETLAL